MTDITPPDGFASAFAEAEAAALGNDAPAPEVDTAEPEAPEAVEPEAAVEAPAVEEPTAAERLLAGKYKTVEELERAYTEAQKMIPESADWRREMDALRSEMAAQQAATPQPSPVQITPDLIERDPASAAVLAFEQNDGTAFTLALQAWKDEDPFGAATWVNAKNNEQYRQEQQDELKKLREQIAPVAQQATQQSDQAEFNAAIAREEASSPGLREFLANDAAVSAAVAEAPFLAESFQRGTPTEKAQALKALHLVARGRQGDTLRATTQEVARQTADEARQAAEDAHVVSATSATSSATEQISPEQEIANSVLTRVKARQDGWNQAWVRNG